MYLYLYLYMYMHMHMYMCMYTYMHMRMYVLACTLECVTHDAHKRRYVARGRVYSQTRVRLGFRV